MLVKTGIATVFYIINLASYTHAQSCITNEELLNQNVNLVEMSNICDDLGKAYVVSMMETPSTEVLEYINDLDIGDKYAYYDSLRVFVMKERSSDYTENMDAQLSSLLVASYLVLGSDDFPFSGVQKISDPRKNYYMAYTLIKYWQYHKVSAFDASLLRDAIGNILSDDEMTGHEVMCFVENDIPILTEQAVFSSLNYSSCISK